jgi:hypothetical protein
VLPLTAARSFAAALNLSVEPLSDPWALRAMQVVTRGLPRSGSALAALVDHLRALAD